MGPPMVTVHKPGIYGIGIPEFITRNKFFIDALYEITNFFSDHDDLVDAFTFTLRVTGLGFWTALSRTGDGLHWMQHDCGLEITLETLARAGIPSLDNVCPRCQFEYQYVWTFREGLSR